MEIGGKQVHIPKELFQSWRQLEKSGNDQFDVIVLQNPFNKAAYEAILRFKADKTDDTPGIGIGGATGVTGVGGGIGGGRVLPVGLPVINKGTPMQREAVLSPSGYTHGATPSTTGTITLDMKFFSNVDLRDVSFTANQTDAKLQTVSIDNVPIFTAAKEGGGSGVLLTELDTGNNRAGFLAGHRVSAGTSLRFVFDMPTAATVVRVLVEHNASGAAACPA